MGDHLSAKAELQSWAGAQADSAVLRSRVTKRTGSTSVFNSKTLLWLRGSRFFLQLLWLGKQRCTAIRLFELFDVHSTSLFSSSFVGVLYTSLIPCSPPSTESTVSSTGQSLSECQQQ